MTTTSTPANSDITAHGVAVAAGAVTGAETVFTDEALEFLRLLHDRFDARRRTLLSARQDRQRHIDAGGELGFPDETAPIRNDPSWRVPPPPADLADRRVEITGPVERKMMINALNSGAKVFMADFEDSCSPTWENVVAGQVNCRDAVGRTIAMTTDEGKRYELGDDVATLMVRPRGLHLDERHITVDGVTMSGALVDFGCYVFHNHAALAGIGSGPYFYLPKLESRHEARWWNEVFDLTEETLGMETGTIRATVLIETITAAHEMEEILYELRTHSCGLNAGRWDYIFSIIKRFRNRADMVLPDRAQVTMTVPFMRAYTDLLIRTCHRRGAHAMGGMAAFIPNRRDPAVTETAMAKVRADKEREAGDGHDGTWVAHPDLVALATEVFTDVLGDRPNQIDRLREDVVPAASALVDVTVTGGAVTAAGVRLNVDVAIQYIASWLTGNGAAAIYNLMEDAATAEISRSQIWQWAHHGLRTETGEVVDAAMVRRIASEELARLRDELGEEAFTARRFEEAAVLFERVALAEDFPDFLTLPALELID